VVTGAAVSGLGNRRNAILSGNLLVIYCTCFSSPADSRGCLTLPCPWESENAAREWTREQQFSFRRTKLL